MFFILVGMITVVTDFLLILILLPLFLVLFLFPFFIFFSILLTVQIV